jgi:hypothetical protein
MVSFKAINSFKNAKLFIDWAVNNVVVLPMHVVEHEDSEKKNPIHRRKVKVVTNVENILSQTVIEFSATLSYNGEI